MDKIAVESVARDVTTLHFKRGEQLVIAVVGPPATGKSTYSEALCKQIWSGNDLSAAVVPMDGFHLDNNQLDRLDLRSRKGSPESFDVHGLKALLERIRSARLPVYYPVFDRSLDKAIAGAGMVSPETDIVIVEGNYLLLDEEPWNQLSSLFDLSIYLETPMDVLETRLIQRWLDYGHTGEQAREKALSNDIPNARRVAERALPATTILRL